MFTKIKRVLFTTSFALLYLASSKVEALDWCSNASYTECGACESFWGSAEYLYWDIKGANSLPVLAETTYIQEAKNGVPAHEVVSPAIGCEKLNTKWRSGAKFSLGYWFDCQHCFAGEVSYFILPSKSKQRSICSSDCNKTLNITYIDANTNQLHSSAIGQPDLVNGFAKLKVASEMQGAEVNGWMTVPAACDYNAGWLVGFRYWNFDEHLKFSTNSDILNNAADVWQTHDKFSVQNNFYGAQIGFGAETAYDQFYLNGKFKFALGALCAQSKINGSLYTNEYASTPFSGDAVEYDGGLFALPSNIGTRKKTTFAVIPDININLGYQFTDCFRAQIGYTFFYVSRVVRAAKQFDNVINPNESVAISGTPVIVDCERSGCLHKSSLWVQGLNVGVEFQF